MKTYIKTILLAASVALSSLTYAETIDVSNLSPTELSNLKATIEKAGSSPENVSKAVRTEAAAWGELGANLGVALVGAAKEVGVAASEFSDTSLGKIVTFVVVYKYMGRDIMGVILGTLFLLFGLAFTLYIWFGKVFTDVTYTNVPCLWGLWNRKVVATQKVNDDQLAAKFFGGACLLIFTTIVGITTIF